MLGVLSVYALGIVVCLVAGVALRGVLRPEGPWLAAETVPLGLCVLVILLYPLGAAMPTTAAGPIALGVVAVMLVVAVARRLRRRAPGAEGEPLRSLTATMWAGWPAAIAIGGGVLAGILLLAPALHLGFPTTLGVTGNDAWGYASLVDWMKDHPFPRDVQRDIAHPLTTVPWNTDITSFGMGFERVATLIAVLTGRDGFEVVGPTAAVAFAGAVGGWTSLAAAIGGRLRTAQALVLPIAVASPLLTLAFAETYTTHFVSLCLWPLAVAAFVRLSKSGDWRDLVTAAVVLGSVVGVYPSMVPWLVLPIAAIALVAAPDPEWTGPARRVAGPGALLRIARAAALVVALAAATVVVALIPVILAVRNLRILSGALAPFGDFFSLRAYSAFFVGATSAFSLFAHTPLGWSTLIAVALLALVALVALVPWRLSDPGRPLLALLAGGVLLTSLAILVEYRVRDERVYQLYKGLISGGAIFAGLVVIGLVLASRGRVGTLRLVGLGCCAALWIPTSAQILQATTQSIAGFHARDVEMGRQLEALPAGSVVLVEGAAPDARSFQLRMMASYFGAKNPGLTMLGLGSTSSYITTFYVPEGLPEWRPQRAWTDVLATGPQPIETDRQRIWSNDYYALYAAPPLDVTPFGKGWYPPEDDGHVTFAWTAGDAELVISNQGSTARTARLRMRVASYGVPRRLSLAGGGAMVVRDLKADALTPVSMVLTLPAGSATPVSLTARPGAMRGPGGDTRQLMLRVQQVRIS